MDSVNLAARLGPHRRARVPDDGALTAVREER
jgi:hypothetical protein